MKRVFGIILLIVLSIFSYSQSKTEFGITTEGAWFLPYHSARELSTKNGFGAGIGVYASNHIFWRFSVDVGLMYRYKEMQQYYSFYKDFVPGYTDGGSGYESGYGGYMDNKIEGWKKYPLHYIVIPVHLQLRIGQSHFIRGGIESTWLTNYDAGKKTEYNWTVGWGSQKHKLKWSVNYIRGFRNVGFYNGIYELEFGNVKYPSLTFYRNNMLQLNLSYPIWQNK